MILAFRGNDVTSVDDLYKLLTEKETGYTSELLILRGTEISILYIKPEEVAPRV